MLNHVGKEEVRGVTVKAPPRAILSMEGSVHLRQKMLHIWILLEMRNVAMRVSVSVS